MVQSAVLDSPNRGGEVQIAFDAVPAFPDIAESVDDQVLAEQLVRPMLDNLGPTQARVAELVMAGFSNSETAKQLGVDPNVVAKALRSMGRHIRAETGSTRPLDVVGDDQLDSYAGRARVSDTNRSPLPKEVVANRGPRAFPKDNPVHEEPFFPQDVGAF